MVSAGDTNHAEAARITYYPSQITYDRLLKIFFSVAHNPTQLNRQRPDTGTHYRSAIFYADDEQKRMAQAYINQLDESKVFGRKIVTRVSALNSFHQAEAYHQNYAARHPDQPYIFHHDLARLSQRPPGGSAPSARCRRASALAGSRPGDRCWTETDSSAFITTFKNGMRQRANPVRCVTPARQSGSCPARILTLADESPRAVRLVGGEAGARFTASDKRFAVPAT